MYISSSYIILLSVYICGDMEMSPIYTDMHFKIMPRKNDLGRRPESERKKKILIVHQQYRKRARSTKDCRHRLTKPGRSRLLADKYVCYEHAAIFQGDAPTEKSKNRNGGVEAREMND